MSVDIINHWAYIDPWLDTTIIEVNLSTFLNNF